MAQIPIIESSKVIPAAAPAALMDPNAAAAPWRGLSSVGQGIQSVANVVQEFELKKQRAADGAGKVSIQSALNKARAGYEIFKHQNKELDKWPQRANELLNGVKAQLSSDKTISADARREIQQYLDLEGGKFLDSANIDVSTESVRQSKLKYDSAIEDDVNSGNRGGIITKYSEMVQFGLIDEATASVEKKMALSHADMMELERAYEADPVDGLADLESGMYSKTIDDKTARMYANRFRRRIMVMQDETYRERDSELQQLMEEKGGATPKFMEDIQRDFEQKKLSASAYRTIQKRALGTESQGEQTQKAIAIRYEIKDFEKEIGSGVLTDDQLADKRLELKGKINQLPGMLRSDLEDQINEIAPSKKPDIKPKNYGKGMIDSYHLNGKFGPPKASVVWKLDDDGFKTDEVDEEATKRMQDMANEAKITSIRISAQFDAWLQQNPNATAEAQEAIVRKLTALHSRKSVARAMRLASPSQNK